MRTLPTVERMVALDVSPSFLIGHVRWWGKAFRDEILGSERAQFHNPIASALDYLSLRWHWSGSDSGR
jgi:predicted amidohydrolase YtcJ